MGKLQISTTYESKLARRNWVFRLFILGILGYTLVFLIPWDLHRQEWLNIVFASSIPIRGVYFLNLLQSLVAVSYTHLDVYKRQEPSLR